MCVAGWIRATSLLLILVSRIKRGPICHNLIIGQPVYFKNSKKDTGANWNGKINRETNFGENVEVMLLIRMNIPGLLSGVQAQNAHGGVMLELPTVPPIMPRVFMLGIFFLGSPEIGPVPNLFRISLSSFLRWECAGLHR